MKTMMLAVAAAVLAAGATQAQAAERLVLEPYPAATPWKVVTDKAAGAQFVRELIPADQTPEAYKDILSARGLGPLNATAPTQLVQFAFQRMAGRCEHVTVNGPTARQEGGYAVAYGQVNCSREIGQPQGLQVFYKVIQGDDGWYLINRDLRVPGSDTAGIVTFDKGQEAEAKALMARAAAADSYLAKSVYLCGPKATDPRCGAAAK